MRTRWVLLGMFLAAMIAPSVLMTLTRVITRDLGLGVIVTSFVPFSIPLCLVALVALVVLLLRRRALAWLAPLAALTVVVLAVNLVWAASAFTGGSAARASGGFRVMTANLLFGNADPDDVLETALDRRVDILVLQEIDSVELAALVARGISTAYPHRSGGAGRGPVGTMTFSRFPLSDEQRLPLGLGGHSVRVDTPEGQITLLAVHTSRPSAASAEAWASDNDVVRRAALAVEGPLVVAGDFNATRDHAPMRRLEADGLTDSVVSAKAGWQPTWPSGERVKQLGIPLPPVVQIDHILLSPELRAAASDTEDLRGTDHRAVVAQVTLVG